MPLQKQMRGLSDVLGLFQGGNIPFELDPGMKASVDALKFLVEPEWSFFQESQGHPIGTRVTVPIPDNEVWILWHMSGLTTIPLQASQTIGLAPIYQDQGVTGQELILSEAQQTNTFLHNTTNYYGQFAAAYPGGIWCADGAIGYIVTGRSGAATVAINWGYQVSKFSR